MSALRRQAARVAALTKKIQQARAQAKGAATLASHAHVRDAAAWWRVAGADYRSAHRFYDEREVERRLLAELKS